MENTSRHRFCIKYRDITDQVLYRATRPNLVFDIKSSDVFHVVAEGERLDLLAYRYYADPALWWVIADANDIKNPLRIEVGNRLRIPSKSTVYGRLNT